MRRLDPALRERLAKLMDRIMDNPNIGKPMRFQRKGTRELYLGPFRLSYRYDQSADKVEFADFYHKKHQ